MISYFQNGLLAILQCVTDKSEYFARCLHQSMAGIGTNDKQLIRLVVTRCEVSFILINVTSD
jgi:annexin A7/11